MVGKFETLFTDGAAAATAAALLPPAAAGRYVSVCGGWTYRAFRLNKDRKWYYFEWIMNFWQQKQKRKAFR